MRTLTIVLRWEGNRWVINRLTNIEYQGEQPLAPPFRPGDRAKFGREIVKVEWAFCTVKPDYVLRWYDVRKGNNHSRICLEEELEEIS